VFREPCSPEVKNEGEKSVFAAGVISIVVNETAPGRE